MVSLAFPHSIRLLPNEIYIPCDHEFDKDHDPKNSACPYCQGPFLAPVINDEESRIVTRFSCGARAHNDCYQDFLKKEIYRLDPTGAALLAHPIEEFLPSISPPPVEKVPSRISRVFWDSYNNAPATMYTLASRTTLVALASAAFLGTALLSYSGNYGTASVLGGATIASLRAYFAPTPNAAAIEVMKGSMISALAMALFASEYPQARVNYAFSSLVVAAVSLPVTFASSFAFRVIPAIGGFCGSLFGRAAPVRAAFGMAAVVGDVIKRCFCG